MHISFESLYLIDIAEFVGVTRDFLVNLILILDDFLLIVRMWKQM